MKVLAIDSSGLVASAAVVDDDVVIGEYSTNFRKTHSQTLLPMLAQLMEQLGLKMQDIDAVAVSGGPGSFTGLRIGAATAKGLGLAADIPVIHVPTLEGLAYNLWGTADLVCPLMDARRNQVYTGLYDFTDGHLHTVSAQEAAEIGEVIARINALGRPVTFLGDGVPVFAETIRAHCLVPYSFAPQHMNRQRAASVAALGIQYAAEGRMESADAFRPEYLRLSQAERERLAEGKSITPAGVEEAPAGEDITSVGEATAPTGGETDQRETAASLRIRRMRPADISEVAALEKEQFTGPWSAESFARALELPNQVLLVAESDERPGILGYAVLCTAADQADLANIAVRQTERRQGIADALLRRLTETAGSMGVTEIFLEVRESNAPAIGLYRKHGFRRISVRKNYYNAPREDALVMAHRSAGHETVDG